MSISSVLVASGENAVEALEPVLREASCGRDLPGLIVLLCRDAGGGQPQMPWALHGVPILALASGEFSDGALAELEAMFLHSPQDGAARPKIVGRWRPKRRAAPEPGGLIEGERLIGESPAVEEIKAAIQRVAATDTNVLITGETGTGKELIAELIQKNSNRRQNPYVCINCAAIPDSLLESELFGYERGAFTGAQMAGVGKLEGANGGTVFFDEIGDMTMYAQAKILRLIETGEIQRLGSRRLTRLDFRVIAATNQDIDSPASSGRFRRDLYFRLNVARIHLPALRERKGDIPLLIRHFIERFNEQFGRRVEGVGEETMRDLLRYEWPGNIRELKNTLEALFVNLPTGRETRLELPDRLRRHISGSAGLPPSEQERLLTALWATDWNKSRAARQLKWSRMTLYRKMVKYQLEHREQCRPAASGA